VTCGLLLSRVQSKADPAGGASNSVFVTQMEPEAEADVDIQVPPQLPCSALMIAVLLLQKLSKCLCGSHAPKGGHATLHATDNKDGPLTDAEIITTLRSAFTVTGDTKDMVPVDNVAKAFGLAKSSDEWRKVVGRLHIALCKKSTRSDEYSPETPVMHLCGVRMKE